MQNSKRRVELYNTVLRYLVFKITNNLKRIYLDIDESSKKILLTAYYENHPTEIEKELLDDIVTNSNAPIPDFFINAESKIIADFIESEEHDYIVFAKYDDY